jgi:ribosome-binding factor A
VPTLTFAIDHSIDTGARIERLLRDIKDGTAEPEAE